MSVELHVLKPTQTLPNSALPLIVSKRALPEGATDPALVEARFRGHGWQGTWTYTVFDYWHFHVEGHEVLACVSGEARVGFGGAEVDGGIAIPMRPGDVVIVPAGVGHKRLDATPDFAVVGAYPPGQNGAVIRAGAMDIAKAQAAISGLSLPERDPIDGSLPGVFAEWRARRPAD